MSTLLVRAYDRGVPELPGGTVTFMFTDVEDSTELLKRLGDGYRDVLTSHRRIIRDAFTARDGIEILYARRGGRDAVRAALETKRGSAANAAGRARSSR